MLCYLHLTSKLEEPYPNKIIYTYMNTKEHAIRYTNATRRLMRCKIELFDIFPVLRFGVIKLAINQI